MADFAFSFEGTKILLTDISGPVESREWVVKKGGEIIEPYVEPTTTLPEPGTTEPGTTEPGTTEPGTTEPGTTL